MVTVIHGLSGRTMAAPAGRRLRHAASTRTEMARDAGFTIAELLVAMVLLAILGATLAGFSHHLTQTTAHGVTRTQVHGSLLDASTQLARDANDATGMLVATSNELEAPTRPSGAMLGRGLHRYGREVHARVNDFRRRRLQRPLRREDHTLLRRRASRGSAVRL